MARGYCRLTWAITLALRGLVLADPGNWPRGRGRRTLQPATGVLAAGLSLQRT